ncbi:hypothetical protein FD754_019036, partial [Muntiacus muntjak]
MDCSLPGTLSMEFSRQEYWRGPPGSSVRGDSPGKNTGVGCHALLQGISPAQESNLYVYIPAGGSQHGPLGALFSTAMTFAFVSFWHGGNDYLWCWATLNWLGVTVENGVRKLVQRPQVQHGLTTREVTLSSKFFLSSLYTRTHVHHTHTRITFKAYHYTRDIVVSGPLYMSSNTFLTTLFNGV